MPALHPQLSDRALHKSVVIGPINTTPIVLDFTKLTYPNEWQEQYVNILSQLQELVIPRRLSLTQTSRGNVFGLDKADSLRLLNLAPL
jgi:hypothetical protein